MSTRPLTIEERIQEAEATLIMLVREQAEKTEMLMALDDRLNTLEHEVRNIQFPDGPGERAAGETQG